MKKSKAKKAQRFRHPETKAFISKAAFEALQAGEGDTRKKYPRLSSRAVRFDEHKREGRISK